MKTHDGRKLSPAAQQELRHRVVYAIIHEKMSQVKASHLFGVGRTSIHNWLKVHQKGGDAALKAHKRGPKHQSRLAGHQAATLVRLITDRCPDQLKLPFALWTRDAVRQLIEKRYGISASVWTVGRYLQHWGFTPQKPLRRAYEQDPQAVQHWLEHDYPAIRRQASTERSQIHWGDEMGMRSDHQAGRSYGLKGHTPVIPGTGQRFGCNMISTVTNRGRLAFMIFKEWFTGTVMIKFLRRLIKQNKQKIFLIIDGHPVHRSRQVKRWVHQNRKRIRLFYLPGYSPQLNPDELLNQDVKTNAVGRNRPQDQPEMMRQVRSYLRSTQHRPQIVKNYFKHKDVHYAAT
ncbi:MAG: IS630 family transposase [Sedimentisphaerales bacterium]